MSIGGMSIARDAAPYLARSHWVSQLRPLEHGQDAHVERIRLNTSLAAPSRRVRGQHPCGCPSRCRRKVACVSYSSRSRGQRGPKRRGVLHRTLSGHDIQHKQNSAHTHEGAAGEGHGGVCGQGVGLGRRHGRQDTPRPRRRLLLEPPDLALRRPVRPEQLCDMATNRIRARWNNRRS
jgi:hypothetical protein